MFHASQPRLQPDTHAAQRLEQYSWRTQETHLNNTLAQFRTTITTPSSATPHRIHFTHIKSPHAHALPLLLLPTFPLTNLSLAPLVKPLSDPTDPQNAQPYHIVAPSIPGLGFSDAFTSTPGPNNSVLRDTAHIFNSLMTKLGYEYYIASSTGSGTASPANIDYHLPRLLASRHSENCLGIHIIDPPVESPALTSSPLTWTKFAIAKFFHASIFGYTHTDWQALTSTSSLYHGRPSQDIEAQPTATTPLVSRPLPSSLGLSGTSYGAIGLLALREPNTLAYALCDSPVGLLSLVLNGLRRISPDHTLSRTDIINFTQLAWLPGPEGAMRFWSGAESETGQRAKWSGTPTGVTVFLGSDEHGANGGYRCPAWAETRHHVVWTKRQEGRGGLISWERGDAIVEGIRGLTKEVLKNDRRLAVGRLDEVVLHQAVAERGEETVVVEEHEEGEGQGDMQLDVQTPETVILDPIAA